MAENMRELALSVLMRVTEEGAFLGEELGNQLVRYQYLEKKERSFLSRLTEGSVERLLELDYIINLYSKTKVRKMKPLIRNLLRIGTYQILYMDQVPDSAACNEAVKLSKKRGFQALSGFVNGVLRTISRQKEAISYPQKPVEEISIRYSLPGWLVSMWISQYGEEKTRRMAESFYEPRPLTIRCSSRPGQASKADLQKQMEAVGTTVKEGSLHKSAMKISGYDQIRKLPGYQKGAFYVQDESSMLAVSATGAGTGKDGGEPLKALDLCAAPGGKCLYLAELLERENGFVSARDISEKKIMRILENKERLGAENLLVKVWDGCEPDLEYEGKMDVVMADLPCSGLGVIGKKQDIKYHVTEEGIRELAALQRKLLSTARLYPKKGGVLVYSTCTVNQEENEENVRWFLKTYPEYRLSGLKPYLPECLHEQVKEEGMLQLFPGEQDTDGFFMARFKRA